MNIDIQVTQQAARLAMDPDLRDVPLWLCEERAR